VLSSVKSVLLSLNMLDIAVPMLMNNDSFAPFEVKASRPSEAVKNCTQFVLASGVLA
jgi:hypothetical protein